MKYGTHRVRALALALLAVMGVALVAAPGLAAESGLTGVVNVNTASVEELQLLPGIGEARALAVIAERKRRGGFKSADELIEVKGIGETGLARLRPHVVLSGKTTAQAQ